MFFLARSRYYVSEIYPLLSGTNMSCTSSLNYGSSRATSPPMLANQQWWLGNILWIRLYGIPNLSKYKIRAKCAAVRVVCHSEGLQRWCHKPCLFSAVKLLMFTFFMVWEASFIPCVSQCPQSKAKVSCGKRKNKYIFDVMHQVRRIAVVLKTPSPLLGPKPNILAWVLKYFLLFMWSGQVNSVPA